MRTLAVQRAMCAVSQKSPEKVESVIDALYRSFWVERNSKIGGPDGFTPILEDVLGKQKAQDVLSAVSWTLRSVYPDPCLMAFFLDGSTGYKGHSYL